MLMRALLVHTAHEIAGAARIRHSLRPLTIGGGTNLKASGSSGRENANLYPRRPGKGGDQTPGALFAKKGRQRPPRKTTSAGGYGSRPSPGRRRIHTTCCAGTRNPAASALPK